MGLVSVQIVQQSLHGGAHLVEGLPADNGRPLRFDRGHPVAGMGHDSTSPVGQADELGASVTGIRLPLQVTELLEVVHQLRGGSQAELCTGGDGGEPHVTHTDRSKDLEVRVANIAIPCLGGGSGQFASEFP